MHTVKGRKRGKRVKTKQGTQRKTKKVRKTGIRKRKRGIGQIKGPKERKKERKKH